MSQRHNAQECPECLGPSSRDAGREIRESSQSVEDHPRWSMSMGATPEDAKAMLKKHPHLEYKYGENGGPLLVRNRQEKKRLMKIHGMEEY
jgi:hypothetical protein